MYTSDISLWFCAQLTPCPLPNYRLETVDKLAKIGATEISLKFLAAPINPSDLNLVSRDHCPCLLPIVYGLFLFSFRLRVFMVQSPLFLLLVEMKVSPLSLRWEAPLFRSRLVTGLFL